VSRSTLNSVLTAANQHCQTLEKLKSSAKTIDGLLPELRFDVVLNEKYLKLQCQKLVSGVDLVLPSAPRPGGQEGKQDDTAFDRHFNSRNDLAWHAAAFFQIQLIKESAFLAPETAPCRPAASPFLRDHDRAVLVLERQRWHHYGPTTLIHRRRFRRHCGPRPSKSMRQTAQTRRLSGPLALSGLAGYLGREEIKIPAARHRMASESATFQTGEPAESMRR